MSWAVRGLKCFLLCVRTTPTETDPSVLRYLAIDDTGVYSKWIRVCSSATNTKTSDRLEQTAARWRSIFRLTFVGSRLRHWVISTCRVIGRLRHWVISTCRVISRQSSPLSAQTSNTREASEQCSGAQQALVVAFTLQAFVDEYGGFLCRVEQYVK